MAMKVATFYWLRCRGLGKQTRWMYVWYDQEGKRVSCACHSGRYGEGSAG